MRMTIIGLLATVGAIGLVAKIGVEMLAPKHRPGALGSPPGASAPADARPVATTQLPQQVRQDVQRALQQGADRAASASDTP